jgi:hypothetical protein
MKQRNEHSTIDANASQRPTCNTTKAGAFAKQLIHYLYTTTSMGGYVGYKYKKDDFRIGATPFVYLGFLKLDF